MAIVWAFLASFLISSCVANAKSIGEQTLHQSKDNTGIGSLRAEQQVDHSLQRRTYNGFSCQTGIHPIFCSGNPCPSRSYHIHFPQHFYKIPVVMVSLSTLDVNKDFNLRVDVKPASITTSSFNIEYTTWASTIIYYAKFSWIACA